MKKISVVINTINEEKNLPDALASVKGFADEVIVCDMYSDDNTVPLAKKSGAIIFKHPRTNYVEPARNFAISKAKGDWIFVLDADEKLTKELGKTLKKIAGSSASADYYRIPRKNIIFGKWVRHSRWWPDYNIRFFKKGAVVWNEIIHSVPVTKGKGSDLEDKEINAIIHNHYETIEQFVSRLNRYTTEYAKNLMVGNYNFNWTDLIKKPASEFFSRYFYGEGYKDGLHGLALSGLQAFSEFVTYLKVWQNQKFEEEDIDTRLVMKEIENADKDLHYWVADTMLKKSGGIKYIIKRKFRI